MTSDERNGNANELYRYILQLIQLSMSALQSDRQLTAVNHVALMCKATAQWLLPDYPGQSRTPSYTYYSLAHLVEYNIQRQLATGAYTPVADDIYRAGYHLIGNPYATHALIGGNLLYLLAQYSNQQLSEANSAQDLTGDTALPELDRGINVQVHALVCLSGGPAVVARTLILTIAWRLLKQQRGTELGQHNDLSTYDILDKFSDTLTYFSLDTEPTDAIYNMTNLILERLGLVDSNYP